MTSRIPVSIITGFLGSGKTTVLSRLLERRATPPTAVLVNEFGEIGIDNDLIVRGDGQVLELANGCICCSMQEDLVTSLGDLMDRRARNALPKFQRILIETTGLADPLPILRTLMTYPFLVECVDVERCVTTVDAVHGMATLESHAEAVRQVAIADRLLLTKTDLVTEAEARSLERHLAGIAPGRRGIRAKHGHVAPEQLFASEGAEDRVPHAIFDLDVLADTESEESPGARKAADICTFAIVLERPVQAAAFESFLVQLLQEHGPRLLRVKGIVNVSGRPEGPAVFHGVQTVLHPPQWLNRWPSCDRRTRIVFITLGLERRHFDAALTALED